MVEYKGSCYCKNITFEVQLSKNSEAYNPRACDCEYCVKQGAAYLSDPQGRLRMFVKDQTWLRKYKQNDEGSAEFVHCINCGVLVAVVYQESGRRFAAVNSGAIDGAIPFGEKIIVSPKKLNKEEKIKRWKEVWFHDVQILSNTLFVPPL